MQPKSPRTIGLGLLVLSLWGCSLMPQPKAAAALPATTLPDAAAVAPLLELMSALPQGDPARQAELFQSVKDAAELTPTTSNRLKYALALATPGLQWEQSRRCTATTGGIAGQARDSAAH